MPFDLDQPRCNWSVFLTCKEPCLKRRWFFCYLDELAVRSMLESSTLSRYSGTETDHPNSWLMRRRSTSDALGSPWTTNVCFGGCLNPRSHCMIYSASACADKVSIGTTSARIGTSLPWIRTEGAPATICAPRVPPAWKPGISSVLIGLGASALR